MSELSSLRIKLKSLANPEKARLLQRFFKTGKGEYGEGDLFLGIMVPQSRAIAKRYLNLERKYLEILLNSKIHEERLIALLILVENYRVANLSEKENIVKFYLSKANCINNWDLVDLSAHKILGHFLFEKSNKKEILYKLAASNNLWEKRIALVSTFYFISKDNFQDSLKLAKTLLHDRHDLIQKALGWMLREIGKRNIRVLESFLRENYKKMQRTSLRYAIEKFPEEKRQKYLKGEI